MSAKLHRVETTGGRKKKRLIRGSRKSVPREGFPCKHPNHLEPDPEGPDSTQGSTEPPVDPPK